MAALLADDWVGIGKRVLSKRDFEEAVKSNFIVHGSGRSPYTIQKKNMQVYLFGNTAGVTFIKEYRKILILRNSSTKM